MKLIASSKQLPLASLISIKSLKTASEIIVEWTRDRKSRFDGVAFDSDASMCRYIARSFPAYNLYGSCTLEYLEVDHWLSFGMGPLWNKPLENSIDYLDKELAAVTYLVGKELTIADIFVWSALAQRQEWIDCETKDKYPNLMRWYAFIESHPCVPETLKMPEVVVGVSRTRLRVIEGTSAAPARKEEGKFIELPGAVHGKVVVRFPPEASGYLHIGHAKAALLNQYYKDHFDGKLVMRFDDTNPAKEKVDFEKVILQDLELLQIKPDKFSHTSDYFDLMLKYCEKLLNEGKAYVDDTDPETMKAEREKKVESKHRSNSVADNMRMWQEMLKGTEYGVKCCVRAKIDMNSANGCMRDPTIYRCKPESHPKTGKKYKVYPTYDFACPIVDSIEGITHCLRTTEYHDRDDQFYWFIDTLGLRKPYIWEYSRLNMMNTVLSKRKLTWFVEEGLVDGWNDPRFPTVQGVMRRGMTVEGLKQFIIAQGSSRSVVMMSWDKIWSFNKKVIDPIAPRYSAVELYDHIPVHVKGAKTEKVEVAKHPKNEEVGTKWVWKSDQILIDRIDADALKENENATFINWGNLLIKKINRDDRWITSIEAEENLSNTDYKGTLKLTWLARVEEAPLVPCICIYFDHLITKPVLGKDEDFKQFLNPNTKTDVKMLGDQELMNVKKGEIIQLQRRGFFICDEEYKPPSIYTSEVGPVILFFVPDGHSKENPITAHSVTKHSAKAPVKPQASKAGKKKKSTPADEEKSVTKTYDQASLKEIAKLLDRIKDQGALVRKLKTEAVPNQNTIDSEVRFLLGLKAEFKELASVDWKPGLTIECFKPSDSAEKKAESGDKPSSSSSADFTSVDLYTKISVKTSKVRTLQKKKADKNLINTELTALADLKEKYKAQTGKLWVAEKINLDTYYDEYVNRLYNTVADQGNRVRDLKKAKASNKDIESEVSKLLALKAAYRDTTGEEYRPAPVAAATTSSTSNSSNSKTEVQPAANMSDKGAATHEQIVAQGNKIRELKANKSTPKETINTEVKALLELKEEYKKATGVAWSPTPAPQNSAPAPKKVEAPKKPAAEKPAKTKQPQKQQKPPAAAATASSDAKKQTRLGLEAKKDENLSDWYTQIITKSELIEYYDVSGCYTLRPWAYAIWKVIRKWLDDEITKMGVDECYFPIFVSRNALEREKTHIADFSPEVAWVTRSGESELEEPVAIRPTSETVMYPAYAKWIRSHRDLPMKLNQWNNVVRWEFKHPQPFLRTREFLWQEGHTAFATYAEAEKEVYEVLELYAKVYEDLLAVPVVRGRKTEKEKFAGGDFTTTVEAFISASGRGIQGGTSHHLGQNFSKMFEIVFEDPETQEKKHVYQNSWGLTTRTIGVMIMIHGDDQGLVLPPRVAKIQAVIVPCGITANLKAADRQSLDESCLGLEKVLNEAGVRVHYDSRDNYSSGWKFNHWELKGVPVRIELGPKDMQQNQVVAVRRDTGEKVTLKREDIGDRITELLANIQQALYNKADKDMKDHTKLCENWSDFVNILNDKNILLSPFCGEIPCEDKIKRDSTRNEVDPGAPAMGAKSLCIPFDQPKQIACSQKCIHPECGQNAKFYALFGRSY